MNETEFNLLYEKWIAVLDEDGRTREVSLTELFEQAHRLRGLAGELAVQDAAVLRMLLAVLYAVYMRRDAEGRPAPLRDGDEAAARWFSLWRRGKFDMEAIGAYLKGYEDRFYLFHPTRPFYQAPITKGTEYSATKLNGLLSESRNKPRLFTAVGGRNREHMDYAAAARWLLYINAYDDTSAKPSERGVGLPSSGAGWLGKIGFICFRGRNLFETLMLNLVLTDDNDLPFPDGRAVWELDEPRTEERVNIPLPRSPLELLTLQSRRILLKRDAAGVTGYLLLGGDIVARENAFIEQMTVWRFDKEKKWVPRRHDPARTMWRDYSSFLIKEMDYGQEEKKESEGRYREPGVVRWVSNLFDHEDLSYSTVTLAIAGVKYGNNDFFVDDLVQDDLSVNAGLLATANDEWNVRIGRAVRRTDDCVSALGRFSGDLLKNNGVSDKGDKKALSETAAIVRAQAYYALDQPFRRWLQAVDPETDDREVRIREWFHTMQHVILGEGRQMLLDAGEKALVGRDLKNNAMVAYGKFRGTVYKICGESNNEQK